MITNRIMSHARRRNGTCKQLRTNTNEFNQWKGQFGVSFIHKWWQTNCFRHRKNVLKIKQKSSFFFINNTMKSIPFQVDYQSATKFLLVLKSDNEIRDQSIADWFGVAKNKSKISSHRQICDFQLNPLNVSSVKTRFDLILICNKSHDNFYFASCDEITF